MQASGRSSLSAIIRQGPMCQPVNSRSTAHERDPISRFMSSASGRKAQGSKRQHGTSSPLASTRDSAGLLRRPVSGRLADFSEQSLGVRQQKAIGRSTRQANGGWRYQRVITRSKASTSDWQFRGICELAEDPRHQRSTVSVSQQGGPRCH